MIDYFPLYDKFRAVSSIQIVLELCVPILAILALKKLFKDKVAQADKMRSLTLSAAIILGLGIVLFIFKGAFHFVGADDDNLRMTGLEQLPEMLRLDRKSVYTSDLLRSLAFALGTALLIWLYLKEKLKMNFLIIAIGVLVVVDLVGVDLRYVNNDNFVSKRKMLEPFQESAADKIIAKDNGVFRVFDQTDGFDSAKTAYFHQSITGYHAAKPAGMQDLFDFHVYNGNMSILNMMNIKYVIRKDQEGNSFPIENPNANGNAWFISQLKPVVNADAEIMAIDSLDTKNVAVINSSNFKDISPFEYQVDSTASISLVDYEPNHLTYSSKNSNEGVAVFSEMYYKNGWNAYIDGKQSDYFKVNYVLRALNVPSGEHKIEFKFEPNVVVVGSKITLASTILLGIVIVGGLGFSFWRSKKEEEV
eukprot:TRINITY_DN854_c0_g1_i2.p1 TRINITY_DN854_c0_g1~~TRINITY_DN854_c0_g1_i2.p1  ORF type:complete len:419 (-),score=92.43 TRINITY_DN854_c0_g1_i2:1706-2962(-)